MRFVSRRCTGVYAFGMSEIARAGFASASQTPAVNDIPLAAKTKFYFERAKDKLARKKIVAAQVSA